MGVGTKMRRVAMGAALAAALVLAGCTAEPVPPAPQTSTATPAPSTATSGPSADPLAVYEEQRLAWTSCGGSFECAALTVPVDYAQPSGATTTINLIRLPAADPGARLGALVINPGGPGGSGVDYARAARAIFPDSVRERYDIVGFDPRGVASSHPVECLTDAQTDAMLSMDAVPESAAEKAALAAMGRTVASGCATGAPTLFAHVDTISVARDVDVLRAALGEDHLDYFGASYGTYIGATYAGLFPTRVGRMVLDGAIDPTLTNEELALGQAEGFETALRRFVAWCQARARCPLSGGVDAGVRQVQQFFASLEDAPLPTGSTRPLTQALAVNAVVYYLYFPQTDFPQLRSGLAAAFTGDGGELLEMLDFRLGRAANGTFKDNSIDALIAVNALDRPDRPGPSEIATQAQRFAKEAPTFGATMAWSNLANHYWQAPATGDSAPIHAAGAAPILVVGTTYDPATPYAWAKGLAAQLDSGHLLTREGDGHTGYGMGSTCTDDAVDAYLIDGTLPADGTVCG